MKLARNGAMKKIFRHLPLALLLLTSPVLAQEAGVPTEVAVVATDDGLLQPTAVTPSDIKSVDLAPLKDALSHKKAGKYGLAVVALLVFLTQLLLRFGPKIPGPVGVWLKSPWVTWLAPQLLSIGGAVVSATAAGSPIDVDLILDAVLLGLAGGGFGAKTASMQAAEAARLAEAEVKTNADAVNIINSKKGPPA